MSDAEKEPTPASPAPANGLGILFLAAALALGLVLSLVALIAYFAFSPRTVNPPSVPSSQPAHEGRLLPGAPAHVRRT